MCIKKIRCACDFNMISRIRASCGLRFLISVRFLNEYKLYYYYHTITSNEYDLSKFTRTYYPSSSGSRSRIIIHNICPHPTNVRLLLRSYSVLKNNTVTYINISNNNRVIFSPYRDTTRRNRIKCMSEVFFLSFFFPNLFLRLVRVYCDRWAPTRQQQWV